MQRGPKSGGRLQPAGVGQLGDDNWRQGSRRRHGQYDLVVQSSSTRV